MNNKPVFGRGFDPAEVSISFPDTCRMAMQEVLLQSVATRTSLLGSGRRIRHVAKELAPGLETPQCKGAERSPLAWGADEAALEHRMRPSQRLYSVNMRKFVKYIEASEQKSSAGDWKQQSSQQHNLLVEWDRLPHSARRVFYERATVAPPGCFARC